MQSIWKIIKRSLVCSLQNKLLIMHSEYKSSKCYSGDWASLYNELLQDSYLARNVSHLSKIITLGDLKLNILPTVLCFSWSLFVLKCGCHLYLLKATSFDLTWFDLTSVTLPLLVPIRSQPWGDNSPAVSTIDTKTCERCRTMLNFLAESDTKQRHDLTDLTSSLASSLPLCAVLSQLKAAEFRVKKPRF